MSADVGKVSYKKWREGRDQLMRMLRVGFPVDAKVRNQWKIIASTISALKKELARNREITETDRLRLLTLEAEFYQQCGIHRESARVLEPVWKELKPRFDQWSSENPLEPTGNRELLRQKIWVLMHYVFYAFYHVAGHHKQALDYLLSVEKIIHSELETSDYCPAGTLALCNYFIGLCYRVNRGFSDAEKRLIAAQVYVYTRVTREISRPDITPQKKQYELDYKSLISARILFGYAWISLQQGHLRSAEQQLRVAQNLLVSNRQESVGVLIDSLLAIVVRRKTPYSDPNYELSLSELADRYAEAGRVHQLSMRRCAFELVRGFLDIAEFGDLSPAKRKEYIGYARKWLRKAGEAADGKSKQRYQLHLIRLLIVNGETEEAEIELGKLRREFAPVQQRAFLILEGVIYFAQNDFDNALGAFKKALAELLPISETEAVSEHRVTDPVLEAECYVLLARAFAAKKDYPAARHYLDKWRLLSQFVDTYYLHHLAGQVVTTEMPFHLEYDYPIFNSSTGEVVKTIKERAKEFEQWLVINALERHKDYSEEQQAKILGKHRSNYSKRFGSLRNAKLSQNRE